MAHFLIPMIAVVVNVLKGDDADAREWARYTRRMRPDASIQQFQSAFPFVDPVMRRRLAECLADCGF